MSKYNSLTIAAYSAFTNTRIENPAGDLTVTKASELEFDNFYPGGLFGQCSFYVPRDVVANWLLNGAQRIEILNGSVCVWEGQITSFGYHVGPGADQGRHITANGYWGQLLGMEPLNKPWADQRISDDVWVYQNGTAGNGDTSITLDRNSRIQFTPKNLLFATNPTYAAVRYTAPTGQTIKRVTYTEELQEGGQAWKVSLYNVGTAAEVVTRTTSGSGAIDHTLATPSQSVEFRFVSLSAVNLPAADGTIFGRFSNIRVYTETGSINAQEILKDIRALITNINSSETLIGALTLSLVPFITDGSKTLDESVNLAVSYGDSSFNAWAAYFLPSRDAPTPDGKPVLVLEQQPALTSYDYVVRINDENLVPPFDPKKDFDGIRNWIIVKGRDELGNDFEITPDDDVTLKDTTSIAANGNTKRSEIIDVGQTTTTNAINIGRRVLASKKDPRFYMSSSLQVQYYIYDAQGQKVPTSQIRAGKRVKVSNFLTDEVGATGAGLTFLISSVKYTDSTEIASISSGVSDDAAMFLAILNAQKSLGA